MIFSSFPPPFLPFPFLPPPPPSPSPNRGSSGYSTALNPQRPSNHNTRLQRSFSGHSIALNSHKETQDTTHLLLLLLLFNDVLLLHFPFLPFLLWMMKGFPPFPPDSKVEEKEVITRQKSLGPFPSHFTISIVEKKKRPLWNPVEPVRSHTCTQRQECVPAKRRHKSVHAVANFQT